MQKASWPPALGSQERLVVELCTGDGRLLGALARSDISALYVGIELNSEQCQSAASYLPSNALVVNGRCEQIIEELQNNSVDKFIAVLPDPSLIDRHTESSWLAFYSRLFEKLKQGGSFRLVTELTDDLLEPVKDADYHAWIDWLYSRFSSIGFNVTVQEGAPEIYSSKCLDQFRGDSERIKLVTLEMQKA